MSQAPVILPGSPLTGAAAAADMNAAWAAMISLFSGTSAPTMGPGASGALVEGQDWLDTSQPIHVWKKWDGTAWCTFGTIDTNSHTAFPPLSWRNVLGDNGGLEVWQRGAGSSSSFALPASTTAYTADRWYVTTQANQASVVAAVAGLTNQSNLAAKITRNSGQTGTSIMVFAFPLDTDEIMHLRGRLVSLSFVAKAGANWSPTSGTLSFAVFVGTGSPARRGIGSYTNEALVINSSALIAAGTQSSVTAISQNVIVPTNTTQMEVTIFWSPTGTAGGDDSITIDDVQLEAGAPTLFERVPFERSLIGCKRHYQSTFPYGTAPAPNAGLAGSIGFTSQITTAGSAFTQWNFPVEMRISPAITTFNPSAANANWRDVTGGGDVVVSVDPNSTKGTKGAFISSQTTALTATHNLYIHAQAEAAIT